MDDKIYLIKDKNGTNKLTISIEHNLLRIKLNNASRSYSHEELIDCDKRFRAFNSVEHIRSFIASLAKEGKIRTKGNRLLTLKQWDIDIPLLNHHSLLNDLVKNFSLQCFKSPLELKVIKKIENGGVYSLCLLKDGRLVSGGGRTIVIYNKDSFQSDIVIQNEDFYVLSVCGLRNGNLAAAGEGEGNVKIYEINNNKHRHLKTLLENKETVNKVIELENDRLCSCSWSNTIVIWDKDYNPIKSFKGHNHSISSIMEINDCIISVGNKDDNSLKIWNKETYECIKFFPNLYCHNKNGLSKLKMDTIILGGDKELFTLNVVSFKSKSFKDEGLGSINCVLVLNETQIIIGDDRGKISCYDLFINQIIFTETLHNNSVCCIIKAEDNKIFSSSYNGIINVYDSVLMK